MGRPLGNGETQPMIVGCYSMDLYCDGSEDLHGNGRDGVHAYKQFPQTFTGERRQDCEKAARNAGWMINNKTGIALCPVCSGKCKVRSYHGPNRD